MDDLQQQIRYALGRYLSGKLPFEAFEDWFVDATWDASREHLEAVELIFAIESHISDYTSSRISERQLKRRLRRLAPRWVATTAPTPTPCFEQRRPKPQAKCGAMTTMQLGAVAGT
jgi:hypothetical protein